MPSQSPWAAEFKESLCDPADELEQITSEAANGIRSRQEQTVEAIPQFEAGHYRDPSKTARLSDGVAATPLQKLARIIETAGVPFRLNHFSMIGEIRDDGLELAYEPTFAWYSWLLRTRQNPSDRLFERYFGRVAIARLPKHVAVALAARMTAAKGFWREKIRVLIYNPPERRRRQKSAAASSPSGYFRLTVAPMRNDSCAEA